MYAFLSDISQNKLVMHEEIHPYPTHMHKQNKTC